jgi:hypothetical protein
MKTTRASLTSMAAMMVCIAQAQTVNFVFIGKQHAYTQVDNTNVTNAPGNHWGFRASVEGSGISGNTPSITLPGSSTGSTTFTYNAGDGTWELETDFSTSGNLDTAYEDGNYGITMLSQTISPISLTGATFPVAPIASLSGGTISSGVLVWNVNTPLTLTLNGTGIDHMGIFVFGPSYNNGAEGFGVTTQSFTIPASAMTAGQNYTVELMFDDVVGGTAPFNFGGTGGMSATQYAGAYTAQTKFTIQAIPEPSTYAAMFGGLALVGVAIRRRGKQQQG